MYGTLLSNEEGFLKMVHLLVRDVHTSDKDINKFSKCIEIIKLSYLRGLALCFFRFALIFLVDLFFYMRGES